MSGPIPWQMAAVNRPNLTGYPNRATLDAIERAHAQNEIERARRELLDAPAPQKTLADARAEFVRRVKANAAAQESVTAFEATHGPTPTGLPDPTPGSVDRGRALYENRTNPQKYS